MKANITLRQLRAFVEVARHGRFSLAAARLSVTPSALSMLVRQLEKQIGARLFDRHTRLVRLTVIGEELLPVTQKTLEDLESALVHSREHSTLRRGRVSVATSTVLAATLMPWAIRRFVGAHPGITFVMKDVVEQEIRDRVRGGDVDLGIGTALDDDPELEAVPLIADELVALLPAGHELAKRRNVTWRALSQQPMIVLGAESPLQGLVERAFAENGLPMAPAYEVSFSSTILSMVAAGIGVAALPVNARQVSSRVRIVTRPLVAPQVRRTVAMFRRRDRGLSPSAAAFQRFLLDYVARGGYPAPPGRDEQCATARHAAAQPAQDPPAAGRRHNVRAGRRGDVAEKD